MKIASSFEKRKEKISIFRRFQQRLQSKAVETTMYPCAQCKQTYTNEQLSATLYVCPNCQAYYKMSAYQRIIQCCDANTFQEHDKHFTTKKYHDFPDYQSKITKNRTVTGLQEAVIWGKAKITAIPVVIVVMDSRFMMASMGHVVGEKITRAIEFATKRRYPLIIICASGGARMQEGIISLVQMAKTSAAIAKFQQAGLLYVSVLTHPTTGGVSASFAFLGDIILAEKDALIGFAGKRVVENTVNEKIPDDFQTAQFLLAHGFVDDVFERQELKKKLTTILQLHEVKS